jgi:hypothetical protein
LKKVENSTLNECGKEKARGAFIPNVEMREKM